MVITSTDNKVFKDLKALTTKKGRREQGLCIIEGEKAIFENLGIVEQVFVREDKEITPNLRDMEPTVLSKKLFEQITDLETCPGILATAEIPTNYVGEAICLPHEEHPLGMTISDNGKQVASPTIVTPFLVLDRIQDPGNMGTILRTAAAFNYKTIYVIDCVDVWSQKVLRAGMGNQFRLNVIETSHTGLAEQISDAKLFVADMGGESYCVDLEDFNYGIVLGNEGQGVSTEIKKLPHSILSIPMENGVESLNVAVAGAILMFTLKKGVF